MGREKQNKTRIVVMATRKWLQQKEEDSFRSIYVLYMFKEGKKP